LRNSFFEFAFTLFGIRFEEWYERGFWDENFECYSLADGEKIISNVSFSKLRIFIRGEVKRAVQISTVGTLPQYRNKGLSRILMEKVINDNDCDLFFLTANNSVIDFYPRFGFKRIYESRFTVDIRRTRKPAARKLDVYDEADMNLLAGLCERRIMLSERFCPINYTWIFMWHALYSRKEDIYYIDDENTAVVCDLEDGILNVHDIVSMKRVKITGILSSLPFEKARIVNFHFTPEQIGVDAESSPIFGCDPFFILGDTELEGLQFRFPEMART
jgi:ribosomal protein S18 acetylase RimI-like enzyme